MPLALLVNRPSAAKSVKAWLRSSAAGAKPDWQRQVGLATYLQAGPASARDIQDRGRRRIELDRKQFLGFVQQLEHGLPAQSRRFQQVVGGRGWKKTKPSCAASWRNAVPGKMLRLKTCTSLYQPRVAQVVQAAADRSAVSLAGHDQVDLDADA